MYLLFLFREYFDLNKNLNPRFSTKPAKLSDRVKFFQNDISLISDSINYVLSMSGKINQHEMIGIKPSLI